MSKRDLCDGGASDRGASALEFAAIAPALLLLVLGMLEFGFVFQAQLAVNHAAREGARLAAVADGSLWDPGVVEQRAYPLTTADGLSISLTEPDEDSVRVTVSYPWEWRIIPFGATRTLSGTATMRKE